MTVNLDDILNYNDKLGTSFPPSVPTFCLRISRGLTVPAAHSAATADERRISTLACARGDCQSPHPAGFTRSFGRPAGGSDDVSEILSRLGKPPVTEDENDNGEGGKVSEARPPVRPGAF